MIYHSAIDWQVSLALDNSRAIHVTAMAIKDHTIYLAGYFTGTLHEAFGGIKPKGKTAGFVVAVDAKNGKTLLWRKNLEVARRNSQATIIPDHIAFNDDMITVSGTTTAGLEIYGQLAQPQSAKDQFSVSFSLDGRLQATDLKQLSKLSPLSAEKTTTPPNGPVVDGLVDWAVGKTMDWATSEIAKKFGINPSSPSAAIESDLNQLNSEMNEALADLATIQNDLNELLGGFAALYNQVLADQSTNYAVEAKMLATGIQTQWDQFTNATVNIHSLSDLSTNTEAQAQLQALLTNSYLASLADNIRDLTSTDSKDGFYYTFVNSLNEQMKAQFVASNYGMGTDPVQFINGYNESLMNIYMSSLVSIQQTYNILLTAAYLQANVAGFEDLVSPIEGATGSFANQQAVINQYFENLIMGSRDSNNNLTGAPGIFDVTSSYLISDDFNATASYPSDWSDTGLPQYSYAYAANYQPQYAKVQANMPPAQTDNLCVNGATTCNAYPWTQKCNVFTWQGVVSNPFTGQYGNGTLKASCDSFDLNLRAAQDTALSYYMTYNGMTSQLQPYDYNQHYGYSPVGSPQYVKYFEISFKGSDNDFTLNQQGFGGWSSSPWIAALDSGLCQSGGGCGYPMTVDSNAFVHSHSGAYQYSTYQSIAFPDGYLGVFNLASQAHDVDGHDQITWDFALQCVSQMGGNCQYNNYQSLQFGDNSANTIQFNSTGNPNPYFSLPNN
ncbi:hypothetical protein [Caedibacter taeniospiralis]|uniref:hypothetical protein n=1 Tax=Caedibacter taeniospiralis TaxID=28907 RepID=UPI001302265D|nr:hypothetical protein [Caedibacter taeniospiralis]